MTARPMLASLIAIISCGCCGAPAFATGHNWKPVHYPVPGHTAPGPGGMQSARLEGDPVARAEL